MCKTYTLGWAVIIHWTGVFSFFDKLSIILRMVSKIFDTWTPQFFFNNHRDLQQYNNFMTIANMQIATYSYIA